MNAAAPTQVGSARERILDTAAGLFYDHGFHAVGVDLVIGAEPLWQVRAMNTTARAVRHIRSRRRPALRHLRTDAARMPTSTSPAGSTCSHVSVQL